VAHVYPPERHEDNDWKSLFINRSANCRASRI